MTGDQERQPYLAGRAMTLPRATLKRHHCDVGQHLSEAPPATGTTGALRGCGQAHRRPGTASDGDLPPQRPLRPNPYGSHEDQSSPDKRPPLPAPPLTPKLDRQLAVPIQEHLCAAERPMARWRRDLDPKGRCRVGRQASCAPCIVQGLRPQSSAATLTPPGPALETSGGDGLRRPPGRLSVMRSSCASRLSGCCFRGRTVRVVIWSTPVTSCSRRSTVCRHTSELNYAAS